MSIYEKIFDGVGYGRMTTVRALERKFKPSFIGLEFDFAENGKTRPVRIISKEEGFGVVFAFVEDLSKQFYFDDNVYLRKDVVNHVLNREKHKGDK